jgi:tetratricopeptide (TPR) repeat protein
VAVAAIGLNAVSIQYRVPSRVFFIFVGLVSAGLAVRTWVRNLDWKDDLTMAKASVETSPHSFKVHRLLAATLLLDDAANIDQAVAEADESTAILRGLPDEQDVADPWTVAASSHLAKANTLSQSEAAGQYRKSIEAALRSIAIEAASRSWYDRRHNVKSPIPKSAADAYRDLAACYLHTGKPDQALSAALHAKTIDPGNVDVYGQMSDAYLAQRRGEDAAIALAEGMFATSNADLRSDLLKLYKEGGIDTEGCAVIDGARGPALNPDCGIVRRDLCAGTARAHKEALRQQLTCPD